MHIISSNYIFTFNKDFKLNIIKNGAIVFNDKIIAIDTKNNIQKQYPNINIEYQGKNSVIMPGLINSHIHLEFSKNSTTLKYGSFMKWLGSVIENREELCSNVNDEFLDDVLSSLIKSGTTTIGAISSYGFDLNSCAKSPINVIYFCEAIGSKADMVDTLFADFKSRLNEAKKLANPNFTPAIAIHSPYSVHPFLIREILKIAKKENLTTQAHFLESEAEKQWLENSSGDMKEFFQNFLNQNSSLTTPKEFLNQFAGLATSFTHCVEANYDEIDYMQKNDHSIIHCPTSNRLLCNKTLDISNLDKINLAIGTDGLSSNISLNMFDELRNALFIHTNQDINELAKILLKASTIGGAKVLKTNSGSLEVGKDADIIILNFEDKLRSEDLATQIILHTKEVAKSYIKGSLKL